MLILCAKPIINNRLYSQIFFPMLRDQIFSCFVVVYNIILKVISKLRYFVLMLSTM